MTWAALVALPQTILQDLRYSARMFYRNASFSAVAVLALGLGIGVNVVAFTSYRAFFNRSIDALDPDSMVNIAMVLHTGATSPNFTYHDYEAYRDQLHSFSGMIAQGANEFLTLSDAGLSVQESPANGALAHLLPLHASNKDLVSVRLVSENYFSVLGIAPLRGRTFENVSELRAAPAIMISENYWQKRFAGNPAVLGRTIRLNGVAFTIIGIAPHDFVGTNIDVPGFWVPLSLAPLLHVDSTILSDRENNCCRLFGRLTPGVTQDRARAEMALLASRLRSQHDPHSEWSKPATPLLWPASPFPLPLDQITGIVKYAIVLIMVAVGMVLVIACANVASLQLARATSRRNELSMRLSLGATRGRLVRQLLTESILLGLVAGMFALLCSWILMRALAYAAAGAFPAQYGTLVFQVTPDTRILVYVFGISMVAGILFGLAPALESSRSALSSALKANASTSPVRSRRFHDAFIAAQVAVALALLIAASMLIRSSLHRLNVDNGYDIQHLVELDIRQDSNYNAGRKASLAQELHRRLADLPQVISVTSAEPPFQGYQRAWVSLNGEAPSSKNARISLSFTYVEPNFFKTLGIAQLSGSNFEKQSAQSDLSAVLSESAAAKLWPGKSPIGQNLRLGTGSPQSSTGTLVPDGPVYQVIGVVNDTRGASFDGADSALIYLHLPEDHIQDHAILVRTQSDARQFLPSLRPFIASIDPEMAVDSYTLKELLRLSASFFLPSFAATIASPVGLIGLLLAAMGIYGTVSYIVVMRTREVGVRMALGAQKHSILTLMLRQSMRPVMIGLCAGVILAMGSRYLLRAALHGLSPLDTFSFVGVSALFVSIALLAAYLPARRAMQVDPIVALRCE